MNKFENMKKIMMILMAVALVALPAMAQSWRHQQTIVQNGPYHQRITATSTAMPSTTFHSTSSHYSSSHYTSFSERSGSMMSSGSAYSSHPAWTRGGTAYTPGSTSTPRRTRRGGLIDWGGGEGVDPDDPGYSGNDPVEPGEGGGEGGGGSVFDPDPNDEDDRPNGSPVGDAMLPLLLFAVAYCARAIYRRKRARA